MQKFKVLVIDDSAFMRKVISDIINQDKHLEVIGTARNGEDGLKKVKQLKPDVITLDIEMPVMDGLTALRLIMEEHPTPVIMLSSLTYEGANSTITALQHGAIDFINKTSGPISLDLNKVSEEICSKVKQAATANIDPSDEQVKDQDTYTEWQPQQFKHNETIIAIGVSTGGPKALQQVLSKVPRQFDETIVIVQHMPAKFTKSLAERLDRLSEIHVKEVQNGELLKKGHAYIAPGDYHLQVKSIGRSLAAVVEQTEPVKGHRPSVNRLFESIADLSTFNKVGVVLTGMGSDGTDGAKLLRERDPSTYLIAESQQTAVIYGMPKSLVEEVNPNLIRPINLIAEALIEVVER
ncbi:protein-glutamate methylesterase/protein-glutamine glutaminase [Alkalibacillus haloalkaliphilus]|uniref:protein-glutamate methylesterase/protein-glutamine glutaminase n=1 Tax=Alkalibacillus haloalkaliphilus TaxID=94136 RepID=UPI0029367134|nr:chemotaxis response regulator protein-glutamate methylesterase [Alkalibacillus haloalkaliphilus]MDV2580620.1 chemotaxis response regulator protein-glutamate methylesterase [Alkalibacillus haloalkaliphilus]